MKNTVYAANNEQATYYLKQHQGETLYTIELTGIKNKPDLIDEPLSKEAIRASDPIIKLPSEP